jgi:hypothetical protein
MPSARVSRFVDTQVLLDEADSVDSGVGDTSRAMPPASTGLRAPSDRLARTDRDPDNPAKSGPLTDEARQRVVDLTLRMMDKLTPRQIATAAGVSAEAGPVKAVIKAARRSLAERAEFYVEAHAIATMQAALDGDAKPAQWALERITEQGERIVDPAESEKPAAPPTFNIGFSLGGVPVPAALPAAVDGEVVK